MTGYTTYNAANTLRFFAFNASGQVYSTSTSAFETWSDANWANYQITPTPRGTSGWNDAATPTGTTHYDLRLIGASLAATSVKWTDTVGAYLDTDRARDVTVASNVASVRGHFDAVLDPGEQAVIIPASTDGEKKTVRIVTMSFTGAIAPNVPVALKLIDPKARAVIIGSKISVTDHSKRVFSGVTDANGVLDLLVWSKATLDIAGLEPVYALELVGTDGVTLNAPTVDCLASTLIR